VLVGQTGVLLDAIRNLPSAFATARLKNWFYKFQAFEMRRRHHHLESKISRISGLIMQEAADHRVRIEILGDT
jgi:hypothetical protein